MYKLEPPLEGKWELEPGQFPEMIEIEGDTFRLAERKQSYPGVIEQYRATVSRDSAHLFVLENGMWVIDHVDEYNPDMGHPVRHFLVDHPAGVGSVVAGAGVLGLAASALYGVKKKETVNVRKSK